MSNKKFNIYHKLLGFLKKTPSTREALIEILRNAENNNLTNSLLIGRGISLDYVTYYDKLLRIEFSVNHLGEKGVFLHFSNPFGSKNKL